ncbi:MAG: hypothetical protein KAR24_00415 [Candidatus Pacebacteria bacterium]|nr:hypothetical protein [Candidatus Paceibacterota bacterium]
MEKESIFKILWEKVSKKKPVCFLGLLKKKWKALVSWLRLKKIKNDDDVKTKEWIRPIAHVIMASLYALVVSIVLTILLFVFFDPKWWQALLYVIAFAILGVGVYVAHWLSSLTETLPNNWRARTIFGWSVGYQGEGVGFLIPWVERFEPPILPDTDGKATFHTKLLIIQMYSEQFGNEGKKGILSRQMADLETEDAYGVGIDAGIYGSIGGSAKTDKERFEAFHKAVFVTGDKFIHRIEDVSEGHLRTCYSQLKLKKALTLGGEKLWEDKKFLKTREETQDAYEDTGFAVRDAKGFVVKGLAVPKIILDANQQSKADGIRGEGEHLRAQKGLIRILDELKKKGHSGDYYLIKEYTETMSDMNDATFFLSGLPGVNSRSGDGLDSQKTNPMVPQPVLDLSSKKKKSEKSVSEEAKQD